MSWTIECHSGATGIVRIKRVDPWMGARETVRWFAASPVANGWISLASMDRLCRVAQKYATRISLERDGWEASGEDEALR